MYYNITQALKRRLILELQDSFSRHPVYRKIVPSIQNRFAFDERPQYGIVIKGSSANKVQLSADNFVGTIQSHVMLAYLGQPVFPIEWVREDLRAVAANGGRMPVAPGIYFIEILSAPTMPGEEGFFVVDPLLTATDDAVLMFRTGIEREAQLQNPPVPGTLRLWQNRRYQLKEGTDFRVNYQEGSIDLIASDFGKGTTLTADYRYAAPSIGPIGFTWNTADFKTLPGVVLAFGKRAEAGNKVAVVVYEDRIDAAEAFGGKFEVTFDMDVIARDTIQMEEISDLAIMYLWAQKKPVLELEGIEIMDVSMGGEAEEIADETGENFFYQSSLSVQLRADWESHVALPITIKGMNPQMEMVSSEVFFATKPILVGRNDDFERIG